MPSSSQEPCCKCKTESATVKIRHALYCNKCFLYVFVGKYRSNINRSKSIARKKGKVLLACSGGPSSIAMLHLTNTFMAVDPNQKKKIAIIPSAVVCHIDESALFDKQVGCAEKLQETCKARYPDLPFISQPLQDIFGPEFLVDANFSGTMKKLTGDNEYEYKVELTQGTTTTTTNEEKLRNLFQTINKNTAKEDLFWYLKFAMLTKIAQREGCEYVFLADSSTRQAIKMISYISHGRGYSIPLDVGLEVDGLYADLTVLRPMKDMLAKEMGLYNRIHRIEQDVTVPQNWTTYMPPKTSIEKLTEDFIVGLDHDFPSTVSTISRTASKLTPQSNLDYSKKCAICLMPFESNIPEWRKHITVTTKAQDVAGCDKGQDCCGGGCSSSATHAIDMNASLCYSCQVDLRDYKSNTIEHLPPFVAETVANDERHERLRSQIQDFLIDDDE